MRLLPNSKFQIPLASSSASPGEIATVQPIQSVTTISEMTPISTMRAKNLHIQQQQQKQQQQQQQRQQPLQQQKQQKQQQSPIRNHQNARTQFKLLAGSSSSSSSPSAANSTLRSHKTDAPMLNYIFDSHLATNKHHHHDR